MKDGDATSADRIVVDDLIAGYLERCPQGDELEAKALLEQHPAHADEIRAFLQEMDFVESAFKAAMSEERPASTPCEDDSFEDWAESSVPGFRILERLGKGGMGLVYRAIQLSLDREVALKVVSSTNVANSPRLEGFRKEARIAAALTDAHILPIYDILEVRGLPVLVMPCIEGRDLGRIISGRRAKKRGISPGQVHPWIGLEDEEYLREILPLLDKLVDAVASLHQAGILHRDVKPSNVLVDKRGNPWLADFGLARLFVTEQLAEPKRAEGTLGFMSPEQVRGEDVDERSDIFSLGVTMYQAVTLEFPYGKRLVDSQAALPTKPSKLQKLLSRELDIVILKATDSQRNSRYQCTEDFRQDWKRAREGFRVHAQPRSLVARGIRFGCRNSLWLMLLVAAVLAAVFLTRIFNDTSPTVWTVVVPTEPRGANGVLVPLDPISGEVVPEGLFRQERTSDKSLVFRRVPPGEYLVVVEVPGIGFHEVLRQIPETGEVQGPYWHQRWEEKGGELHVHPVIITPDPTHLHFRRSPIIVAD
jgi:eukaryotic-like serine/threonine-protein kinase